MIWSIYKQQFASITEDFTTWKLSKYGVFPVRTSCIRSEYRKVRTGKNSVFGHFSRSVYLHFRYIAVASEIDVANQFCPKL